MLIQYQLWFSHEGLPATRELQEEQALLKQQFQRMQELTALKHSALDLSSQEELLEEQARESYHYQSPDEIFVSFQEASKYPLSPGTQASPSPP